MHPSPDVLPVLQRCANQPGSVVADSVVLLTVLNAVCGTYCGTHWRTYWRAYSDFEAAVLVQDVVGGNMACSIGNPCCSGWLYSSYKVAISLLLSLCQTSCSCD